MKNPKMKWKHEKKNESLRKEKTHASGKETNENGLLGKVLREVPGLLPVDEGHTPRKRGVDARVLGVADGTSQWEA